MANTNVNTAGVVKYAELTDEHIADVKRNIEIFLKSDEYWDKFAHHSIVPRGHRTFTSRRLIRPKVKAEDIAPRAELIAPRPSKMAVATFEKTVQNYGDKAYYTREDLQFHFDDTVDNLAMTLKEIAVQKLDLIKGKAFVQSRAIITYETSLLNTLDNAAIIFRKNQVKRWAGNYYLCHLTPEALKVLRGELKSLGVVLDEKTKVKLSEGLESIGSYGDWTFSVTTSDVMYKSASVQYLVLMGRRGIDGESPVDVSKLEGESAIEVLNNGLGNGVIEDEDGKIVEDSNKQKGSLAINMDGLGAVISDDLAILNCEVSINEVKGTALALGKQHGFKSRSGNEIAITESCGTKTHFKYDAGVRIDASDSNQAYASGNTVISVQVLADEGEAFSGGAAPASAANWSATYKLVNGGDDIAAEILAVVKTAVNYDTLIVRVPDKAYSFTIASVATAD